MPDQTQRFRFRPRYRALAWGVVMLGLILLGVGLLVAQSTSVPVGVGAAGVALGLLYLGSPAWRITVFADAEALEVRSGQTLKFRLCWEDIVEVVASPGTATCFVDGGRPASSLLVPGVGASAPYDIENKAELYAIICARVPGERIRTVTRLDQATPSGGEAAQTAEEPAAQTAAPAEPAAQPAAEPVAATPAEPAAQPAAAAPAEPVAEPAEDIPA